MVFDRFFYFDLHGGLCALLRLIVQTAEHFFGCHTFPFFFM